MFSSQYEYHVYHKNSTGVNPFTSINNNRRRQWCGGWRRKINAGRQFYFFSIASSRIPRLNAVTVFHRKSWNSHRTTKFNIIMLSYEKLNQCNDHNMRICTGGRGGPVPIFYWRRYIVYLYYNFVRRSCCFNNIILF